MAVAVMLPRFMASGTVAVKARWAGRVGDRGGRAEIGLPLAESDVAGRGVAVEIDRVRGPGRAVERPGDRRRPARDRGRGEDGVGLQQVAIVRRRDDFERHPANFAREWQGEEAALRHRVLSARDLLPQVQVPDAVLEAATRLCLRLGTDGLRAELTLLRAARAMAALDGDPIVTEAHLLRVVPSALRHRLRRDPLDEAGSTARIARAVQEQFGSDGVG